MDVSDTRTFMASTCTVEKQKTGFRRHRLSGGGNETQLRVGEIAKNIDILGLQITSSCRWDLLCSKVQEQGSRWAAAVRTSDYDQFGFPFVIGPLQWLPCLINQVSPARVMTDIFLLLFPFQGWIVILPFFTTLAQ
jgi:hypothetical protein